MRIHALTFLCFAAILAFAPTDAAAQVRPDAPRADSARAAAPHQGEHPQGMEEQLGFMMPMMGNMVQALTQSSMAALAEPKTAEHLAKFIRNYHQALVAEGFTREEAMRIVISVGFPAPPTR